MTQDEPTKLSIQTETQTETHIDHNKHYDSGNYELLDTSSKERIMNVIIDSEDILLRYKSSSYVYPNWLNISDKFKNSINFTSYDFSEYDVNDVNNVNINESPLDSLMIMNLIGFFVMTRVIDSRFMEIPEYRSSVNNPFHRALWHIAHYSDFKQILTLDVANYKLLDNDSMYKKFFRLLDTFCILSRVKTIDEFKASFHRIYRNITSCDHEDHNIVTPMWIYNKYSNMTVPPIYVKYPHLTELPLIYLIGSDEYYKLLCKKMAIVPRFIKINDIANNRNNQISTCGEQDLSAIDPCIIYAKKYDIPNTNTSNESVKNYGIESIKNNGRYKNNIKYNQHNNLINIKSSADTSNNWRKV